MLANIPLRVSTANLDNLGFCKFSLRKPIAVTLTVFAGHICAIVGRCAQEQVRRIHATRVVACVANKHAFWDRAIMQFIAVSMNQYGFIAGLHFPVSAGGTIASPYPTTRSGGLADPSPEAGFCSAMGVVSMNKMKGLPLNRAVAFVGVKRNWRGLTATTFAKFYGRILGGIIEGHRNLLGCGVKPWDARTSPGQLFAYPHYTPSGRLPQPVEASR